MSGYFHATRVTPQPEPTPEPVIVIARYVGLFSCNEPEVKPEPETKPEPEV